MVFSFQTFVGLLLGFCSLFLFYSFVSPPGFAHEYLPLLLSVVVGTCDPPISLLLGGNLKGEHPFDKN